MISQRVIKANEKLKKGEDLRTAELIILHNHYIELNELLSMQGEEAKALFVTCTHRCEVIQSHLAVRRGS